MRSLETKIPPPVTILIIALAMRQGASLGPYIELSSGLKIILISAFLILGILVAVMGIVEFKKAKTTTSPLKPEKTSSLVSSGIYGITRNPMYVGATMVLMAWAIHLSSIWGFIGIPCFILYINRFQITPEEQALKKLFGSDFDDYQAKVRRWL